MFVDRKRVSKMASKGGKGKGGTIYPKSNRTPGSPGTKPVTHQPKPTQGYGK